MYEQRVADLVNAVSRATSLEALYALVQASATVFECEHAIYHSIQQPYDPFALATYQNDWADYYEREELYLTDPVVRACFSAFLPYDWKSLDWSQKPARQLRLDAAEGGVASQGITIPIRGPNGELAIFSLNANRSDEQWAQFLGRERDHIILIAHHIHSTARRIAGGDFRGVRIELSPREKDSLTLLSLGENRARAAEALNISEHTLRVYIESARQKLGATNTVQAVASAVSQGLIRF